MSICPIIVHFTVSSMHDMHVNFVRSNDAQKQLAIWISVLLSMLASSSLAFIPVLPRRTDFNLPKCQTQVCV